MKSKLTIIIVSILLVLTGCVPSLERGENEIIIVEESDGVEEQQYIITPTIDTPENFYRNVLQEDGSYYRSPARGTVAPFMNNRIDINQFELGLMEVATTRFSQDRYFFREGNTLSGNEINSWLRRYNPNEDRYRHGLNPSLYDIEVDGEGNETAEEEELSLEELEERMRERPQVLSHLIEHQYFYQTEDERVELGGIVIGLALNSVYYFRLEDDRGLYTFHEQPLTDEMIETKGREIAQEVVFRLRGRPGLEEIPITIALYREERRGSIVPGSFISMTSLDAEEAVIDDWEAINEEYYFFPSAEARREYPNESNNFNQFRVEVEEFFGRSIGIVGKGRYKNELLEEMTIELNLQSHGKPEIVALTQFISNRVNNIFTASAPIYVYVNSVHGPESLIIYYPNEEPYIHIYK
ncbi:CamS family sex pheromone protein [Evansella sp. AB-P1]|uniref:CamS family sex pheromone protein n=1 Tax=Evansella sp. AB-P1 TaxID=3037653 RepID=UPI00241ED685|nr:CamS family sex pheromone protein [Evansella sp. AB-P1]MDG5785948.1 CamS family sex pheromone protein [Evansella sp. AB-P1]